MGRAGHVGPRRASLVGPFQMRRDLIGRAAGDTLIVSGMCVLF
jgi:hypothetical protein